MYEGEGKTTEEEIRGRRENLERDRKGGTVEEKVRDVGERKD